jgi:hypothetical protein
MAWHWRPAKYARENANRDCGGREQISEGHCGLGVDTRLAGSAQPEMPEQKGLDILVGRPKQQTLLVIAKGGIQ